jgi:hypothetical protein
LEAIKNLDIETITEMINRGAARVLKRAKPTIEFEHPVMLAIDMTYIAYYGQREELVRMQGAPEDKSYDWCHKVATASIVGDNVRFTAAMLPIGDADDHDPEDTLTRRNRIEPAAWSAGSSPSSKSVRTCGSVACSPIESFTPQTWSLHWKIEACST